MLITVRRDSARRGWSARWSRIGSHVEAAVESLRVWEDHSAIHPQCRARSAPGRRHRQRPWRSSRVRSNCILRRRRRATRIECEISRRRVWSRARTCSAPQRDRDAGDRPDQRWTSRPCASQRNRPRGPGLTQASPRRAHGHVPCRFRGQPLEKPRVEALSGGSCAVVTPPKPSATTVQTRTRPVPAPSVFVISGADGRLGNGAHDRYLSPSMSPLTGSPFEFPIHCHERIVRIQLRAGPKNSAPLVWMPTCGLGQDDPPMVVLAHAPGTNLPLIRLLDRNSTRRVPLALPSVPPASWLESGPSCLSGRSVALTVPPPDSRSLPRRGTPQPCHRDGDGDGGESRQCVLRTDLGRPRHFPPPCSPSVRGRRGSLTLWLAGRAAEVGSRARGRRGGRWRVPGPAV